MNNTKIGLIQVIQRKEDSYIDRTAILYSEAEKCFAEGADLVFFPEAYQYRSNENDIITRPDDLLRLSAEWHSRCSALAKKYHSYLIPWDYEYSNGSFFNSSYILDRDGNEIGRYHKVHLTYREQQWGLTPGTDFPVFDLDIGKVGIMICFDNYFPESARCLGNRGAQLVVYPLFGDTLVPQWELKLRTRAVDNSMYIAATQIDAISPGAFTGLVSPDGNVICKMDKQVSSHKVVEINIENTVITHTMGNKNIDEKIRPYLERCRNPKAYDAIIEVPEKTPWEDIFCDNSKHSEK